MKEKPLNNVLIFKRYKLPWLFDLNTYRFKKLNPIAKVLKFPTPKPVIDNTAKLK